MGSLQLRCKGPLKLGAAFKALERARRTHQEERAAGGRWGRGRR